MSLPANTTLEFKELSKGLLTFSPETGVPDGFYVDAQNMLLTNKAPITVGGLTKFNTTACPNGNIIWFEPYTSGGGNTVMVVATDTGRLYKYDVIGDAWTELRRDFTSGQTVPWNSVPFRGQLIMANASGLDRVHKYDGIHVLPVGAKLITDFEDAASWTNGSADTSEIREGLTSLTYSHGGAGTITASRVIGKVDLTAGLNGAPDFGNDDLICVQLFVSDASKINNATPQQEDTNTDSGVSSVRQNGTAGFYDWAFQFTAGSTFNLAKVQLDLQKIGDNAGNLVVEIQTDSGGLPSNTPITDGVSVPVQQTNLPSTQWSRTDFTFTTPPALNNGTVYHIVLKASWTPDGINYAQIRNITGAGNLAAVNTSGAATTWVENAKHTNWKLFSTTSSVVLSIETTLNVDGYFAIVTAGLTNGWNRIQIKRSAFGVAGGSPSWSNINGLKLTTTATGAVTVKWDDWYIRYNLSPPIGKIIDIYGQQLCVAGIPSDPTLLQYSDAGTIDYFSADQTASFSGGRHALEKTDQITALFSYFDELLVGKVNSAWTFSGTGLNVSISALPLTIGIDTHHGIVETPWSVQYLFENNIFGARLTSRGLVSTNISSLLSTLDNQQLDKVVAIRHDRTRTLRWSFRTLSAVNSQNDLGLIYDYILDAWASRYTPKIRWITRGIVNGNRELLCAQYDGYVRRMDTGTTFDGTDIESYVTMPWVQLPDDQRDSHVSRWFNVTCYLKGTANVMIEARFADEPHEFATATFATYGTVQATPDGDKGFAYLGPTSRWMQLRLRSTSLGFEVCPPIVIGMAGTDRRV